MIPLIVLLTLLLVSSAQATTLTLTGGSGLGDFGNQVKNVVLDGPDFQFTGDLFDDNLGVFGSCLALAGGFCSPGQSFRMWGRAGSGSLDPIGTLVRSGQSVPVVSCSSGQPRGTACGTVGFTSDLITLPVTDAERITLTSHMHLEGYLEGLDSPALPVPLRFQGGGISTETLVRDVTLNGVLTGEYRRLTLDFVLTDQDQIATPEPATWLLLLTGAGVLWWKKHH